MQKGIVSNSLVKKYIGSTARLQILHKPPIPEVPVKDAQSFVVLFFWQMLKLHFNN
jgi:hypothetical protein